MNKLKYSTLSTEERMAGMILNDSQKLEPQLDTLKSTKFKNDVINQIFQAITNTEKPFIDIFKKCGMEVLAYAMSLSNLCQQETLNRGYETRTSKL